MGRKRLDNNQLRIKITIRIPRFLLQEVDKLGKRTEIIEQALIEFLKNNKK